MDSFASYFGTSQDGRTLYHLYTLQPTLYGSRAYAFLPELARGHATYMLDGR